MISVDHHKMRVTSMMMFLFLSNILQPSREKFIMSGWTDWFLVLLLFFPLFPAAIRMLIPCFLEYRNIFLFIHGVFA